MLVAIKDLMRWHLGRAHVRCDNAYSISIHAYSISMPSFEHFFQWHVKSHPDIFNML